MTAWEKFGSMEGKANVICSYYKEKGRNGAHTGSHGAGCPKECPLRESGGHCRRDTMSAGEAERFLDEGGVEEKKVRCIDCKHLRVELIKQRNLPDSICINPLWKELGRAPHVIGHDEHEPIRCDHFEKKEGRG